MRVINTPRASTRGVQTLVLINDCKYVNKCGELPALAGARSLLAHQMANNNKKEIIKRMNFYNGGLKERVQHVRFSKRFTSH